jgi:hypothetical protein
MSKVWDAIKRAAVWIRRVLEDADGTPSSKRVQSFGLIIFGCFLAANHYDVNILIVIFGAALGLQGITAFQR